MKKPRSCLGLTMVFVVVLGLLAVLGYLIARGTTKIAKEGNTPPTVIVNSPASNDSIEADSFMFVNVTAVGQNPITRIELWLDGSLLETQTPEADLGEVTTFYATTSILMAEGPHMFSARAVDSKGLVGQSLPLAVQGRPRLSQNENDPSQPQPPSGSAPSQPTSPGQSPSQPSYGGTTPQPPVTLIPPAPLPVPPPDVEMVTISEYKPIDLNSFLPILLSGRPKAPTSLKAGYENCRIRLVWTDNADNETHFNVWMQALGGPPRVIATLKGIPQTGSAWYEFASPITGIYSFWIEAVNALGGQSSEIAWAGVTDLTCGPGVATQLNIEITDMSVPGGYNQAYCYLSVEGAPEKRTPTADGTYIPVLSGSVDVSNWTGSGNRILLSIPADNEITLEGKCLGRKGGAKPDSLGTFGTSAPKESWDGRRMEIAGTGYTIGYRILPLGSENATGNYGTYDFTLQVPYDLKIEVKRSSSLAEQYRLNKTPTLRWKWDGKPNDISGFTIFLNDKPFIVVGPNERGHVVNLPAACGISPQLSVAANYKANTMSVPAQPPVGIFQIKCGVYVEVKFEKIRFWCLDDGDTPVIPFVPLDCESGSFPMKDTIESYYYIHANGQEIKGSGNLTTDTDYYFQDLNPHNKDMFLVPMEEPFSRSQSPTLRFGLHMKDGDPWYDADDHICGIGKDLSMPYSDWMNYDNRFELECHSRDADGKVTILVRGFGSP